MAFPKGGKNPNAGRKPGIPNAINRQLKETILEALEKAHPEGAIGYLTEQSSANPTAFMSLIGKVLPMQIGNADGEEFKTQSSLPVQDRAIIERFLNQHKEPTK